MDIVLLAGLWLPVDVWDETAGHLAPRSSWELALQSEFLNMARDLVASSRGMELSGTVRDMGTGRRKRSQLGETTHPTAVGGDRRDRTNEWRSKSSSSFFCEEKREERGEADDSVGKVLMRAGPVESGKVRV